MKQDTNPQAGSSVSISFKSFTSSSVKTDFSICLPVLLSASTAPFLVITGSLRVRPPAMVLALSIDLAVA